MTDFNGIRAWFDEAQAMLERIVTSQADVLEQTAQLCAESIATDGLVHLFGTGHSRMPVEEMFPRYGSFPGFHPIVELSMSNHFDVVGTNGQRQAMFIERVPGLAKVILDNFSFRTQRRDDGLQRQRPHGRARGAGTWRPSARLHGRGRDRRGAVALG